MNEEEEFLPGGFAELLREAQQVQEELQAQLQAGADQMASVIVEGQAGGGAVRVTVSGDMEFRAVRIRPDALDPSDPDMLEDLVLAAVRDAVTRVKEMQPPGAGPWPGAAGPLQSGLFGGGGALENLLSGAGGLEEVVGALGPMLGELMHGFSGVMETGSDDEPEAETGPEDGGQGAPSGQDGP